MFRSLIVSSALRSLSLVHTFALPQEERWRVCVCVCRGEITDELTKSVACARPVPGASQGRKNHTGRTTSLSGLALRSLKTCFSDLREVPILECVRVDCLDN